LLDEAVQSESSFCTALLLYEVQINLMSRGFVKESDQEEPPIIPPRASLPDGVTNYVTPQGKVMLREEKLKLEKQRADLTIQDDTERRRELAVFDGKLKLLDERLNTAQVLNPEQQNKSEIRFGAHVKFKMNGSIQDFKIVGVDEANIKEKKIAFTSPLARAMTSKRQGDNFEFKLSQDSRPIEILRINY
jgi:transcription elongation factor GreB